MKKTILTLIAIASVATVGFAQSQPRVIVVNVNELLSGYYKAQEAFEKFQSSAQNYRDEVQMIVDEIERIAAPAQELEAIVQNRNKNFSEERVQEARQELQGILREVQQRRAELREFQVNSEHRLSQREQQIVSLHLKEIQDVVAEYAQAQGADLVLNTAAGVVYAKDSFDETDAVLAILNAAAPSDSGTSGE